MNKLLQIQAELKAPKNQHNSFGNYNFRNKEDIFEALKPLLLKYECVCWVTDTIVQVGARYYIKATANFVDGDLRTTADGWAREEESQKGMQGPQISGSSSSYAGKYALGNLFLLDDTKDSDSLNKHDKEEPKAQTGNNLVPITPKDEPNGDAKKYSGHSEHLRYIGHINERKEGKAGFVSYVCGPMELSTKMAPMIEKMDSAYDNKTNVQIDYTEVVNGRWTNRYIQAVAEVPELPF